MSDKLQDPKKARKLNAIMDEYRLYEKTIKRYREVVDAEFETKKPLTDVIHDYTQFRYNIYNAAWKFTDLLFSYMSRYCLVDGELDGALVDTLITGREFNHYTGADLTSLSTDPKGYCDHSPNFALNMSVILFLKYYLTNYPLIINKDVPTFMWFEGAGFTGVYGYQKINKQCSINFLRHYPELYAAMIVNKYNSLDKTINQITNTFTEDMIKHKPAQVDKLTKISNNSIHYFREQIGKELVDKFITDAKSVHGLDTTKKTGGTRKRQKKKTRSKKTRSKKTRSKKTRSKKTRF